MFQTIDGWGVRPEVPVPWVGPLVIVRLAEPTEHGGEQRLGQVRNTSHSGQALNQFILEDSSTFICIPVSSNLCCHFLYLLRNLEPLGCYLVPDAQSHPPIVATLSSERDSAAYLGNPFSKQVD